MVELRGRSALYRFPPYRITPVFYCVGDPVIYEPGTIELIPVRSNNMIMKKSQLKEAVKAVVRQCLNERVTEGCRSGSKKRFKGKAGRMFKHVEDSEEDQENLPK